MLYLLCALAGALVATTILEVWRRRGDRDDDLAQAALVTEILAVLRDVEPFVPPGIARSVLEVRHELLVALGEVS